MEGGSVTNYDLEWHDPENQAHNPNTCTHIPCNTNRIIKTIHEQGAILMASIQDCKDLLATLTTQEAGETYLAPGQIAVSKSDVDDLHSHIAALIDAAPAPAPNPNPNSGPNPPPSPPPANPPANPPVPPPPSPAPPSGPPADVAP